MVNDGFVKMTGYSKSYAKDKTLDFYKGEKTTTEADTELKLKLPITNHLMILL